MKEINKKMKKTSGWWGALSAIRGGAWLTSTQMQSSTTMHIAIYSDGGTEIQSSRVNHSNNSSPNSTNWLIF